MPKYFCYICKTDLSARVSAVGGSTRKRYPAHTRVTIHVSNGKNTIASEVWACEQHAPPLQDAFTSVGAKLPKLPPKPKEPRIEIVNISTGRVEKTITLSSSSARHAEKVLSGVVRMMDTDRFYAREMDVK